MRRLILVLRFGLGSVFRGWGSRPVLCHGDEQINKDLGRLFLCVECYLSL